jgi:hypothetical protein
MFILPSAFMLEGYGNNRAAKTNQAGDLRLSSLLRSRHRSICGNFRLKIFFETSHIRRQRNRFFA